MTIERRSFILGATAILAALPRAAAARHPLSIAYPDKSPPNSWRADRGIMRGILVDLMAEVAAKAGYDFDPRPLPLPRVQSEVESGATDGMCLVATPARLKYALPSAEPLTTGHVTMFVRRDSPMHARLEQVRSLDDLAATGATVIAIQGNGWIKHNIESRGIRTVFANGTIGTVRMLIGNRGDVIVDMSHQITWITKHVEGGAEIEELPAIMDRVDWHLLISKKSPVAADMPKLDAAIHDLKANGKFATILGKYGIKA
ncbi:substrate-binding periplasmic protein [Dongia sp.]|uniref:substrate-binding periplasmic protein n=1 Tax=Dongia sp. TaxID=1977262 RepID=UPI0035B29529